jgi:hypothetical protein
MSILKLFVMFASGLSSVCHFGHDGEITGVAAVGDRLSRRFEDLLDELLELLSVLGRIV